MANKKFPKNTSNKFNINTLYRMKRAGEYRYIFIYKIEQDEKYTYAYHTYIDTCDEYTRFDNICTYGNKTTLKYIEADKCEVVMEYDWKDKHDFYNNVYPIIKELMKK